MRLPLAFTANGSRKVPVNVNAVSFSGLHWRRPTSKQPLPSVRKPTGATPANGSDRSAAPAKAPVITTNSAASAVSLAFTTTAKVPSNVPLPSARLKSSAPLALTVQFLAPGVRISTSHGQSGVPSFANPESCAAPVKPVQCLLSSSTIFVVHRLHPGREKMQRQGQSPPSVTVLISLAFPAKFPDRLRGSRIVPDHTGSQRTAGEKLPRLSARGPGGRDRQSGNDARGDA